MSSYMSGWPGKGGHPRVPQTPELSIEVTAEMVQEASGV